MAKRTLRDVAVAGKRLLIRVDFNVPLEDSSGEISNDRRIRMALPTIRHGLEQGSAVIVMSHLGRPTGDPASDKPFRMDRVADRLRELLGNVTVQKCEEVVGEKAAAMASQLAPGEVLVLENVRFHPGEKKGEKTYAQALRSLADVYVNDAFGTCHRTDGTMYAVPLEFPSESRVVGFLVEKELLILDQLLSSPPRPLVAVMGGAKVSDKIDFIEALLKRVDRLLIGGAMTYTFLKAMGQSVGNSRVENDKLDFARGLLERAQDKLVLPADHVIADSREPAATVRTVEGPIPDGWAGFDIGPKARQAYREAISSAGTVVWNGPMGMFEDARFEAGTKAIAQALADSSATTIVGGGESAEAVEQFGLSAQITHVSTGGGAFLEYVEGKPFKPLSIIPEKT